MTDPDHDAPLQCSRCGRPQPSTGPLRTSDGTPISTSTYLNLAGLAGDALVCPDCVESSGAPGGAQVSHPTDDARIGAAGYTETLLDEHECRRLLATQAIGRLAFTQHTLPVIVPAHFTVRGPEIVLATPTDGRVATARRHAVVAFGADAYDATTQQGWWVCTLGRSRLITDRSRVQELDDLGFTPWAQNRDRNYIAIDIHVLRGRRLAPITHPEL